MQEEGGDSGEGQGRKRRVSSSYMVGKTQVFRIPLKKSPIGKLTSILYLSLKGGVLIAIIKFHIHQAKKCFAFQWNPWHLCWIWMHRTECWISCKPVWVLVGMMTLGTLGIFLFIDCLMQEFGDKTLEGLIETLQTQGFSRVFHLALWCRILIQG